RDREETRGGRKRSPPRLGTRSRRSDRMWVRGAGPPTGGGENRAAGSSLSVGATPGTGTGAVGLPEQVGPEQGWDSGGRAWGGTAGGASVSRRAPRWA